MMNDHKVRGWCRFEHNPAHDHLCSGWWHYEDGVARCIPRRPADSDVSTLSWARGGLGKTGDPAINTVSRRRWRPGCRKQGRSGAGG
jgi:hypothetical protein